MVLENILHRNFGRWRRITAGEARVLYEGTIEADSRVFKCAKCDQFVTFVYGDIQVCHFRHSRAEEDKSCEDRRDPDSTVTEYFKKEKKKTLSNHYYSYKYPLKIEIRGESASFLIGFPPLERLNDSPIRNGDVGSLVIYPQQFDFISEKLKDEPRQYLIERLNDKHVVFLPVGSIPAAKYTIEWEKGSGDSVDAQKNIEEIVDGVGVDRNTKISAIFSVKNGRMIPIDKSIKVGEPYYLLTDLEVSKDHLTDKENPNSLIKDKEFSKEIWPRQVNFYTGKDANVASRVKKIFLYQFRINRYNDETRDFIRKISRDYYTLTPQSTLMIPVWPAFVQRGDKYRYYSTNSPVRVFVQGDCGLDGYPRGTQYECYECPKGNTDTDVRVVSFREDQKYDDKILCATSGDIYNFRIYNSIYLSSFSKDPTSRRSHKIEVFTGKGSKNQSVQAGYVDRLPEGRSLTISARYDGYIEIRKRNRTVYRQAFVSGEEKTVPTLKMGHESRVYQGLDCCWKLSIRKTPRNNRAKDHSRSIYRRLTQSNGERVQFSFLMARRLAHKVKSLRLKNWILQQAKVGTISSKALRLLNSYHHTTKK